MFGISIVVAVFSEIFRWLNGGNNRTFQHFFELPIELRMMIINQIPLTDRCRFTRCSKLSRREAANIYELDLGSDSGCIRIKVTHRSRSGEKYGFILVFLRMFEDYHEHLDRKYVKYLTLEIQELWEMPLDGSKSLVQHSIGRFEWFLHNCQWNLKKLRIDGYAFRHINIGPENFRRLEDLYVRGIFDIRKIFSKLQKPLEKLCFRENDDDEVLEYEQIYQAKQLIWWINNFTNKKFLKLTAKDVSMRIGKLTENNIFDFIKSWQNGTIGKDIEVYRWDLRYSTFDKQKLFKLLNRGNLDAYSVSLKQFAVDEKTATLSLNRTILMFK